MKTSINNAVFNKTHARRALFVRGGAALLVLGCLSSMGVRAQGVQLAPYHHELYDLDSGLHTSKAEATETEIVFEASIKSPGAVWMRLLFSEVELGRSSHISVHSLLDGDFIVMGADDIKNYGNATCFLNGEVLHLQLHLAPGDKDVFVRVGRLHVGDPLPLLTQCGAQDNRVASTDNRVGRLFIGGCTAWRVTNGAFLTAGHCVDFDPDAVPGVCGPLLPDGTLDLTGVVEFNIPASTAAGFTNAALANDQYPIDLTSVTWRFDGCGQGLGKDWAVFGVNVNANTQLMPHEVYGLPWRVARDLPNTGATFRVTGCGSDTNASNFTLQTHTGPFNGEVTQNTAADLSLTYQIDTTGGNSGSPVIWEPGLAMGIHTNGGCATGAPIGNNSGTSFEVNALETAIRNFTGTNAVFCDRSHPLLTNGSCPCDGTVMRPFDTVINGVNAVSSGGVVSIVAGSYTEAAGNAFTTTKAQTWEAPCGTVVIGN